MDRQELEFMIRYQFVEKAETKLLEQIFTLYRSAGWWPEEADLSLIDRMISGSHCFLTAMDDQRLVGMGRVLSDRASDAYLQDLTVHPDYRHQGIGTRLLEELLGRIETDGLPWIGLIAERNSFPFYAPFGFQPMPDSMPMLHKKS